MTSFIFNYQRIQISNKIFSAVAVSGIILAIGWLFSSSLLAANVLSNSDFETSNFNGWTTFGPNNYVEVGASAAHSGNYYYKVYGQFTGAYNYTGIYQDIPAVAGNSYSADGWAYSLSSDGGGIHQEDAIWLEVSFRDASDNALALYRSAVVTGTNISKYGGLDTWFNLSVTNQCYYTNSTGQILFPGTPTNAVNDLVAPAGTAYVRYQTVFEQGSDNADGSMYFDDLTLNEISGTEGSSPPATNWNIVWNDEFNGDSLNTSHWTFDTGNGFEAGGYYVSGWGNNELEYYTSRTTNVYVANGLLHIHAQRESYDGQSYTSARLKSAGLFTKKYGRFEWRAKMPTGTGFWPALWMLPQNSPYGGWPNSGEIDVVENKGNISNQEGGTIHYGGANGNDVYSGQTYTFPGGDSVADFHTYLLEWTTNKITWYVDGHLYETQINWWSNVGTSSSTYPFPAPFDQPFYIIMNLAIGGNYLGNPNTNSINASLPGEMQVDYVRVYDQTLPLKLSSEVQPDGKIALSWPANIVCHLQVQTNSVAGANWANLAGSANPLVVSPDRNEKSVFYRLQSP